MKRVLGTVVLLAFTSASIAACTSEGINTVGEVPGSTENTGGTESRGDSSSAHGNNVNGGNGGIGGYYSFPTGGGSAEGGVGGRPPGPTCVLQEVTTTPDLTPTDQCDATYRCDNDQTLIVSCDGENDGTDTSLCDCHVGQTWWKPGDLFEGEGPETCLAAAVQCAETMPDDLEPEPEEVPPAIDACALLDLTVTPSELSPTDGCAATYDCGGQVFTAGCDGENDGTNTSLCDCTFGETTIFLSGEGGLFQGEGPDSCLAAAVECAEAMKASNER